MTTTDPITPTAQSRSPRWAVRGLPAWSLLITLPICLSLMITPLTDPVPGPRSVAAWLVVSAAAACFIGLVLTRYRRGTGPDRLARLLLLALAGLSIGSTLGWSPAWASLFVLLAVGAGIVVLDRTGPALSVAIASVAVTVNLLAGAAADEALLNGLTVLLTGLGTYAIHQLFATVAELRCTRRELAKLAVTEERDRFARDLHDLLGHTLSVIVVKAEAVRRLAPLDSAAAASHAADIETIGREALTDIRRAAGGYRGAGLDRELTRARAAFEAAGVTLSLEPHPTPGGPLPEDVDVLLGWVLREGATNVVRHTRATHCTIAVRRTDRTVRLTIQDDGRARDDGTGDDGIRDNRANGTSAAGNREIRDDAGSGLAGLAERVTAAGGTVSAGPVDRGFRIAVEVPVRADRSAARGTR
jgi:two-component system sensor histidine kinase DesK